MSGRREFWWRVVLLWVGSGVGRDGERWWRRFVGGPGSGSVDGRGSVTPGRKLAVLDRFALALYPCLLPVSVSVPLFAIAVIFLRVPARRRVATRVLGLVVAFVCGLEAECMDGWGRWGKGVAEVLASRVVDPTRYFLLLLHEGVKGLGRVVVLSHGVGPRRNKTRPHFIFSVSCPNTD